MANGAYSRAAGSMLTTTKSVGGGSYQVTRSQQKQRIVGHSKEGSGGSVLQSNHSVEVGGGLDVNKAYFNQNSQLHPGKIVTNNGNNQFTVGINSNNLGKN